MAFMSPKSHVMSQQRRFGKVYEGSGKVLVLL